MFKKNYILLLVISLLLFIGCSNQIYEEQSINVNDDENISKNLQIISDNKINYLLTDIEMECILEDMIKIIGNESSFDNRSCSNDIIKIKLVKKDFVLEKIGESSSRELKDCVPIYYYNINDSGFAITTTDQRVGIVIAISLENTFDEINDFIFNNIESYINKTLLEWNTINNSESRNSNPDTEYSNSNKYTYSNIRTIKSNTYNILKVKWNQSILPNGYPTGCGPVAVGQVFTKIRPFNNYDWFLFTQPNKNGMAVWNYYTTETKNKIENFLFDIGKDMKCHYTESGTATLNSEMTSYFKKKNIKYKKGGYSLNSLKESLKNGNLTIVEGTAGILPTDGIHYFILDGWKNCVYTVTNKQDGKSKTLTSDFVHVNFGWGGVCDGYYLSGIWNTNNPPIESDGFSSSIGNGNYKWYNNCFYDLHK